MTSAFAPRLWEDLSPKVPVCDMTSNKLGNFVVRTSADNWASENYEGLPIRRIETRSHFHRSRPNLAESGPDLANMRPSSTKMIAQSWSKSATKWRKSNRDWPK